MRDRGNAEKLNFFVFLELIFLHIPRFPCIYSLLVTMRFFDSVILVSFW